MKQENGPLSQDKVLTRVLTALLELGRRQLEQARLTFVSIVWLELGRRYLVPRSVLNAVDVLLERGLPPQVFRRVHSV